MRVIHRYGAADVLNLNSEHLASVLRIHGAQLDRPDFLSVDLAGIVDPHLHRLDRPAYRAHGIGHRVTLQRPDTAIDGEHAVEQRVDLYSSQTATHLNAGARH